MGRREEAEKKRWHKSQRYMCEERAGPKKAA